MAEKERWIQEAIKRPGALRAYVRREYGEEGFDRQGRIKVSVLKELAEKAPSDRVRRRARLALTLRGLRRRKD